MTAFELIERAQALCRRRGIPFPSDLRQYAAQWQREQFNLEFCWRQVKPLLSSRLPLWQAEIEIRRHYARLRSETDAQDRKAGEPLEPTPAAGQEPWWESPEEYIWSPEEDVRSPASVGSLPDEPDDRLACVVPRQTLRPPRQPYRKRPGTLAHKVRELLKAHVVRRGPISVYKLERIAKSERLLREDQTIGRCSTFRRIMKELNIESHRVGYGPGASYVWRLKPPSWTRGLEMGVHD
jgi:hypothetical protein